MNNISGDIKIKNLKKINSQPNRLGVKYNIYFPTGL